MDSVNLTVEEIINYLLQFSKFYPDISMDINLLDISDRVFIAAAIASHANYIVTGDKHLLALKKLKILE